MDDKKRMAEYKILQKILKNIKDDPDADLPEGVCAAFCAIADDIKTARDAKAAKIN